MTTPNGTRSPWILPVIAIGMAGLVLGVVTQLLQGILPGPLAWIANSLSVWLLAAFLAGTRLPSARMAALAGVGLLVAALAGYYLAVQLRFGYGASRSILLFWGLGALVGGSVFGADGFWWRRGSPRVRAAAAGLLAALFVAEGVYLRSILEAPSDGNLPILLGLAIPAVLGRSWRERGAGYLAMLPALALGAAGYAVLFLAYGVITGT